MKKSDKQLEGRIILQLTQVCEAAKADYSGFIWLTHTVNYQRFPQSLKMTLVFNQSISESAMLAEFQALIPKVQSALEAVIGERLSAKQIEACREHHTLQ